MAIRRRRPGGITPTAEPRRSEITELIYQQDGYEVIARRVEGSVPVLAFSERKEPPPADFFAHGFLERLGTSFVIVRSLRNSWYIDAGFDRMIAVVAERIRGMGQGRPVLYGASMGSFGCLRAAHVMPARRMILCAPVLTLDPAIERRWMSDYARDLAGYLERMSGRPLLPPDCPEIVAIHDPFDLDARHVDLAAAEGRVARLPVPRAGHMVMRYLLESGVLSTVIRALIREDQDVESLRRLVMAHRRRNLSYLRSLHDRLGRKPRMQGRVLSLMRREFPDRIEVMLLEAEHLARTGRAEAAGAVIRDVLARHGLRAFGMPLARALAQFAAGGGDPAAVREATALLASDRPRSREVQLWWSRFLRHAGRYDEAWVAHESFMKGDSFEAHAHLERGLILESCGLLRAARSAFARAVELAPDFPPARAQLGRIDQALCGGSDGS